MRESATYQAILREGGEIGEIRGIRRTVLALGTNKFGPPDAAAFAAIEGIHDPDVLERLAINVNQTSSWRELLATVTDR